MKYEEIIYASIGKKMLIKVKEYTMKQLEKMENNGNFFCPGDGCQAKLCLVHNSKNGGRTYFFKAVDDEEHNPNCDYKIDNYKEISVRVSQNGVFTESQINDAVRRIYKDYTQPIVPENNTNRKKKGNSRTLVKASSVDENVKLKKTTSAGRIIYGDENIDGIKGRVRRRYQITSDDIGQMATICGIVESIRQNTIGEMFIMFKEERLKNIKIFIGPVYEHNNQNEYKNLYLVKDYFEKAKKNKDVIVAAGGLVNKHNGDLVLEMQANGSFRVDNQTVMKMVVENVKRKYMKE